MDDALHNSMLDDFKLMIELRDFTDAAVNKLRLTELLPSIGDLFSGSLADMTPRWRMIETMAEERHVDPKTALTAYLDMVLQKLDPGCNPYIVKLRDCVKSDGFSPPKESGSSTAITGKTWRNKPVDAIYLITSGRKMLNPGEWCDIDDMPPDEEFDRCAKLEVPLFEGENVVMEIKCGERIRPNNFEKDVKGSGTSSDDETYSVANPFFPEDNLVKYENGIHVFRTKYAKEKDADLGECEDLTARRKTAMDMMPMHFEAFERLLQEVKNSMLDIYRGYTSAIRLPKFSNHGTDSLLRNLMSVARSQQNICTQHILRTMYRFLCDYRSLQPLEPRCLSLPELMRLYHQAKSFPGHCKEASVLTTGFANCLGFPARRIAGYISLPESKMFDVVIRPEVENGGHVWTEVYIPSRKIWIPVDATSNTVFRNYPERGSKTVYRAEGYLPQADYKNTGAKLRVAYC